MICALNTVKIVAGREKAVAREWRGSKISKNLEIFIRCFCQGMESKRSQPFFNLVPGFKTDSAISEECCNDLRITKPMCTNTAVLK